MYSRISRRPSSGTMTDCATTRFVIFILCLAHVTSIDLMRSKVDQIVVCTVFLSNGKTLTYMLHRNNLTDRMKAIDAQAYSSVVSDRNAIDFEDCESSLFSALLIHHALLLDNAFAGYRSAIYFLVEFINTGLCCTLLFPCLCRPTSTQRVAASEYCLHSS